MAKSRFFALKLRLFLVFLTCSFLLSNQAIASGLACQSLFESEVSRLISESQVLQTQFVDLRDRLENKSVLTGNDVKNLNQHFNAWLNHMGIKLIKTEELSNRSTLSREEALEAIELSQSIYSSYMEVLQPMFTNTKWRRILNREDADREKDSFTTLQDRIFSYSFYSFYRDLIDNYLNVETKQNKPTFLKSSALAQVLSKLRWKKTFINARDILRRRFEDTLHIVTETIGLTSDTFPLRRGLLADRFDVLADFMQTLKPMDIVADRANRFKLSHMIIPGYYGHAGIYLGSKEQLIEAGLWEDPRIVPYHQQIEDGYVMLEAKRTGVKLRKLEEYLNTDTVTGFRQRSTSLESLREKMAWALSQVGKTFDHTFDLEHTESYFCSKLIYFTFTDVPWPTR